MHRPTLFRVLLEERRWDSWVAFCLHFEQTARELSKESNSPRLANVTVARKTFDRWASGTWYGRPWPDAARILEHLFGFPIAELFTSVPHVLNARASVHDREGLRVSGLVGQRCPTSWLFISATEDVADSWELTGRQDLDATTVAVPFHPASRDGDHVRIHPTFGDVD